MTKELEIFVMCSGRQDYPKIRRISGLDIGDTGGWVGDAAKDEVVANKWCHDVWLKPTITDPFRAAQIIHDLCEAGFMAKLAGAYQPALPSINNPS